MDEPQRDNELMVAELDMAELPLVCPLCYARCEFHPQRKRVPHHFHCMSCGAVLDLGIMAELLKPILATCHHQ